MAPLPHWAHSPGFDFFHLPSFACRDASCLPVCGLRICGLPVCRLPVCGLLVSGWPVSRLLVCGLPICGLFVCGLFVCVGSPAADQPFPGSLPVQLAFCPAASCSCLRTIVSPGAMLLRKFVFLGCAVG